LIVFLLLIIGLVLVGATVALAARAIALPRLRAEERVVQIGSYGFPVAAAGQRPLGPLSAALDRLAERVGSAVLPRVAREDADEVRLLLSSAGVYSMSPGRFLGYRGIAAVGLVALWLWFAASNIPVVLAVLGIPLMAVAGWVLPLTLLRRRAQRRGERIDGELPELIDSLVVTVEAGIGLGGALRLSAQELQGPLGEEINLMLQEQSMGLSSNAAMQSMLKRADTPSMRSFVRAVTQSESLGVSLGEIMRGLAVEMRSRRRARAEARAQQAPVKMLFPLVFCIFPAILITLLYPAIKTFSDALG
jgi:tight adherence protein C